MGTREENKRYYEKHKNDPKFQADKKRNTQAHIDRKKAYINGIKSKRKCRDCGESNPVVLDFHHIDPSSKNSKLKLRGGYWAHMGWKPLDIEISKCEVLCANCHRILEDKKRNRT